MDGASNGPTLCVTNWMVNCGGSAGGTAGTTAATSTDRHNRPRASTYTGGTSIGSALITGLGVC
jgi:hypothetical protein